VATLGHASRTKNTSRGSTGAGTLAQLGADHVVVDELLGELGEQPGHLLERRLDEVAGVYVEREVDALGQALGLGHAVGDGPLRGHVLEVGRAPVEEERQVAIVERHLRHAGREWSEPEREAGAAARESAAAVVERVHGGLAAQVTDERGAGDLGYVGSPLLRS